MSLRLPCTLQFYIYISVLSHSSHFIFNPKRELIVWRTLLPSSFYTLHPFVETVTSPRDRLLGKSSLLFSYLSFFAI